MKHILRKLLLIGCLLTTKLSATTLFVDVNSSNPQAPYATWSTAAADIQSAIDVAQDGDQVIVNDGIYQTGGRLPYSTALLTNRVVVDKAILVQSVNGPAVTSIVGYQIPGVTNGLAAMRGVYLTNNATLSGFTVRGGATIDNGGTGAPVDLDGGGVFCSSNNVVVTNCIISGNVAEGWGGGISSGTIYNSLIESNRAFQGGGTENSTLTGCKITGNYSVQYGGGSDISILNRCVVSGNISQGLGGGLYRGVALNSAIFANVAATNGGASFTAALYNCTVTGNSAQTAGGESAGSAYNCILLNNTAVNLPNYSSASGLTYCCTTPTAIGSAGSINADPQITDFEHIAATSPCRGAGGPANVTTVDIDGDLWIPTPSIGCDQIVAGPVMGSLNVVIGATDTNVSSDYPLSFIGQVTGHATTNIWSFGDGTYATNEVYISHGWRGGGDYAVTFSAFNDSNPGGISSTVTVHVVTDAIQHVAAASVTPTPPYLTWATAATNIQDAIDAWVPGATIQVSNGVYQTGGRAVFPLMTNRVALTKPIHVASVNGPTNTIIVGYQLPSVAVGAGAIRCAYLTNGASLTGFTLTGGATRNITSTLSLDCSGGGAWCVSTNAEISNCILAGNYADLGGGVYSGTLNNCLIVSNVQVWSGGSGGGADGSILNNCTVAFNRGISCGGALSCQVYNSIVYDNADVVQHGFSNYLSSTMAYTCTLPMPTNGPGNFTNDPAFANVPGGDFRLQPNSPCINSGNNQWLTTSLDLDGRARISGQTVDMGAYEFPTPTSIISYAWLQQYGLATDGSADFADTDTDGLNNWQEWIAGTVPTNAASVLRLAVPSLNANGTTLTWQSVSNRTYFIQGSTDLAAQPAFVSFQSNILGQAGTTSFTDNAVTNAPYKFYRVGVQGP